MERYSQWVNKLKEHTLRWGRVEHPETGRECTGVQFVGTVGVTDSQLLQDPGQLAKLRQVIDIVRLLALAEPPLFALLLQAQLRDEFEIAEQRGYLDAIIRRVPLAITFELELEEDGVSALNTGFLPNESVRFEDPEGVNAIARQELIKSLTDSQREYLQCHPVPVSVIVGTQPALVLREERKNLACFETEDFFASLETCVAAAKKSDQTPRSNSFLPVSLACIKLALNDVWITPRVIQSATNLTSCGIPIELSEMNIDPRHVQCSEDELRSFLRSLTKLESKLQVTFGQVQFGDSAVIDKRGQDRSVALRMIINAVHSLPSLDTLDLTRLLRMIVSPSNRRLIIRELLLPVLSRTTPLASLRVDTITLSGDDIDGLHTAAEEWRRLNPGKLLRVKCAILGMSETETESVHAFMRVLDDAEEIHLHSLSLDREATTNVLRAVLRYPSLKSLSVQEAIIESMDLFDPLIVDRDLPVKPLLRSLDLKNFELHDQPSMNRFLAKLKDTSHPLSQSLQTLKLDGDVYSDDNFTLNDADRQLLGDVLRYNRVLADIDVSLTPVCDEQGDPDFGLIDEQFEDLQSTRTQCVPDLDARQAEDNKARNRAFLSALTMSELSVVASARRRLDASVLRVIFGFSAPHLTRWISVNRILEPSLVTFNICGGDDESDGDES